MSLWQSRIGGGLMVAAVAATAVGMSVSPDRRVTQGECRNLNGAPVCVWAEMTGNTLTRFGVDFPVEVIENAPAEAPMVWPPVADATIPLPDAVRSAVGFDNLTIFWEPHGHPPGPFLTPHFDFHFNSATTAELAAIDCADQSKPSRLAPRYELPDVPVPQMGTLIGLCVPSMGMHAVPGPDLRASTAFGKTMVVGYYHARPIFVEPMIARATLLERRSFSLSVPSVPDLPAGVRAPSGFRAEYDRGAQSYRFAFTAAPAGTR
jgi:hypothetical protein